MFLVLHSAARLQCEWTQSYLQVEFSQYEKLVVLNNGSRLALRSPVQQVSEVKAPIITATIWWVASVVIAYLPPVNTPQAAERWQTGVIFPLNGQQRLVQLSWCYHVKISCFHIIFWNCLSQLMGQRSDNTLELPKGSHDKTIHVRLNVWDALLLPHSQSATRGYLLRDPLLPQCFRTASICHLCAVLPLVPASTYWQSWWQWWLSQPNSFCQQESAWLRSPVPTFSSALYWSVWPPFATAEFKCVPRNVPRYGLSPRHVVLQQFHSYR